MNRNKDFQNYLTSKRIGSGYSDEYFKHIQKRNNTTSILSDNDIPVDVFSKLLDEKLGK